MLLISPPRPLLSQKKKGTRNIERGATRGYARVMRVFSSSHRFPGGRPARSPVRPVALVGVALLLLVWIRFVYHHRSIAPENVSSSTGASSRVPLPKDILIMTTWVTAPGDVDPDISAYSWCYHSLSSYAQRHGYGF